MEGRSRFEVGRSGLETGISISRNATIRKNLVRSIAYDMPLEGHIRRATVQFDDIETMVGFVFYDDAARMFVVFELNENSQWVFVVDDDVGHENRIQFDVSITLFEVRFAVILEIDFRGFRGMEYDAALS